MSGPNSGRRKYNGTVTNPAASSLTPAQAHTHWEQRADSPAPDSGILMSKVPRKQFTSPSRTHSSMPVIVLKIDPSVRFVPISAQD
ncbi:hypothetical protein LTR12_017766 [Friedmanniomyces endolithicus]|uniref:Uncharacterized protein n=2 Tax=Friedmanniomyces TaxID=329881 RepID=A0A4U0WWR4_9PEZI|nr:hypothetical protein LTR12_017766 [Friedmanniomyces endolithicus]TKA68192.1 hypothetical protein B0A55_12567 [Friedmanniomyces simplex]